MNSPDLVSCIMPTRNRRQFIKQAIWYFLRQDYQNKELIILDDGDSPMSEVIPADERIRYVRMDQRQSLGRKRNLCCEMSRGSVVVHWDDDDWMSSDRISRQVSHLLQSDADVCGASELLYYHPVAGQAWLYRCLSDVEHSLPGGTLAYRRAAWKANPFPATNIGEDAAFLRRIPRERISAIQDSSFYIGLIHSGNTARKNLSDRHWVLRPLDEVSRLFALDRDFYAGIRNPGLRHTQRRPVPEASGITVAAPFAVYDGYGSMAEFLVIGLVRSGVSVSVAPLGIDHSGLTSEFEEILRRSKPDPQAPVLYFSWPKPELQKLLRSTALFVYTMWESSRLPADWPAVLNLARGVIVPTRFVAEIFRKSGVTAPVEVVPQGVDPLSYHYEDRPERSGITTLIVGTVIARKHVAEGIAAWKMAFAGDPRARLIIKARFNYRNYVPDDPRIQYVDSNETTRGIAHWYRQSDVLLALGNEGFGLPLVEAMATGLPVIALNSEGQRDICEEAGDYLLPVSPRSWQEYNESPYGRCGLRGFPGIEDVAERLRWVASHPVEAAEMGRLASAWVLKHRNVWDMGPSVAAAMEQHLHPARPLRRRITVLVSSWGKPCGIAEYTAHLSETLPRLDVTPGVSDFRSVRLLHVQHEHGIFTDTELTRCVQQAHLSRIPVVITEHSVTPQFRSWERDADALIALTEEGANTLRSRWPGKPVHRIPHGCPPFIEKRKASRGRVIGAFGFLGRHKGFWHVLDALQKVRESEFLLFSYAKSSDLEAEWDRSAAGLRVRRHREFLPSAEVAQRLAEEADILVFWYDDICHASASGAVHVGLSTGVPVLASPTRWFSELRNVTYQPDNLVEGIERLLDDSSLRDQLNTAARDYCNENSWPRTAERHAELWRSLGAA